MATNTTDSVRVVELLTRLSDPGGGLWHPGECVAFDREVADRLVARGVARYVEDAAIVDGPPADKMVAASGAVRKWPRRRGQ